MNQHVKLVIVYNGFSPTNHAENYSARVGITTHVLKIFLSPPTCKSNWFYMIWDEKGMEYVVPNQVEIAISRARDMILL